jgi:hypothetical protein
MLQHLEIMVHHEIPNWETNLIFSYRKDEDSNIKGFYMNLNKEVLGYRTHMDEELIKEFMSFLSGYLNELKSTVK